MMVKQSKFRIGSGLRRHALVFAVGLAAATGNVAQADQREDCYQAYAERDLTTARQECQGVAEQNDARAAFILATIYYQEGSAAGDQRGIFWDKVAAENGHAEAAYRLALAYQLGQGLEQSNTQAVRWYTQAAQAHHAKAQRSLGAMYEGGYGVKQNLQQAFFWYNRAAVQGLPDAQLRLGTMFFEGRGVAVDKVRAQHWIRKSAEAGNHNAQLALGVMLAEIDPQDSARWYQRSADQGNVSAKQNLALVYFSGQGVERDLNKALALVDQAIESGNLAAQPLRDQIMAELQPQTEQVAVVETAEPEVPEPVVAETVETGTAEAEAAETEEPSVILASVDISPENLTELTTEEPPAAIEAAVKTEPAVVEEPVAAEPAVETVSEVVTETQPVAETKAQPEVVVVTAIQPVLEKESGPYGMEADDWLMKQPSDRYVIQLTNGEFKEGMEKYIRRVGLKDVEGWHYYRTQRDAGLYYVLVYGEYETVAAAKKALKQLPRKARRSHWVRQYSTLQKLYRVPGSANPSAE